MFSVSLWLPVPAEPQEANGRQRRQVRKASVWQRALDVSECEDNLSSVSSDKFSRRGLKNSAVFPVLLSDDGEVQPSGLSFPPCLCEFSENEMVSNEFVLVRNKKHPWIFQWQLLSSVLSQLYPVSSADGEFSAPPRGEPGQTLASEVWQRLPMTSLLALSWPLFVFRKAYGMWFHASNVGVYILYLMFLTIYITSLDPMMHIDNNQFLNVTTGQYQEVTNRKHYFSVSIYPGGMGKHWRYSPYSHWSRSKMHCWAFTKCQSFFCAYGLCRVFGSRLRIHWTQWLTTPWDIKCSVSLNSLFLVSFRRKFLANTSWQPWW